MLILIISTIAVFLVLPIQAQLGPDTPPSAPEPVIEASPSAASDAAIQKRLSGIFSEIEGLEGIEATVREGVVILSGEVPGEAAASQANALALRIQGVVTTVDNLERSRAISTNVSPLVAGTRAAFREFLRALPLIALAGLVFTLITLVFHALGNWSGLWRRLLPNPFLAELVAQAVRITGLLTALVVALNLIGATTLMGAILGGAGVLGIAVGFAVRDSLENYISSVMLSLRQPFRANEHVVIDGHEGKVVRLTSRATVLMTLDGNHLRIPNSTVFKAIILNYTRNPERRLSFELGVDANDDPLAAITTGVNTLCELDFILKEPAPSGVIQKVGDSNIVLIFYAWVNQSTTDFGKARGLAIARTKAAIETGGFSLPEPIYRLRLENGPSHLTVEGQTRQPPPARPAPEPKPAPVVVSDQARDVSVDHHLDQKVREERAEQNSPDLLDHDRPVE